MKTIFLCHGFALALLSCQLSVAQTSAIEKVQFKNKQVVILPSGKVLVAPNEVALPFSIVVRTNGTYTVKDGRARALQEGEILGANGMLVKPDGSIAPVMDHVTMTRGKVMLVKDGQAAELQQTITIADGSSVAPDGKITPRGGSERRLLDGELFQLDGGPLPTRDSITRRNGRVIVQKDGSQLTVGADRSITMNDGTKVMGDGTIIKFNGDRMTLTEGQIFTLEGVVKQPR